MKVPGSLRLAAACDRRRAFTTIVPAATAASGLRGRGSVHIHIAGKSHLSPRKSALQRCASTQAAQELRQTPLYDLHVQESAKMVPFAGYSMPVQYADLSVGDSHRWTREKASVFDVGHMVQHRFSGPGAEALLKKLTPASTATLKPHHSTLSCLLHPETGGIVDDTIITRLGSDSFYVVTNAGCREKDIAYFDEHLDKAGAQVQWEVLEGWGLVALQGPLSAEILESVLADPTEFDVRKLYFGQSKFGSIKLPSGEASKPVLVSRGGYTGEDGFEISFPPDVTVPLTQSLLRAGGAHKVRLAGLGARDSLRLEAGLCLYGHDLDDTTTPVEAGLSWVIGKDRRAEGGFFGSEVILQQLRPVKDGGSGVTRRRVGLTVEGAPAREGAEVVDGEGNQIGIITSGSPSPTLKKNIAMGYIKNGQHKSGTEVGVVVRGKRRSAVVTKMPFVPTKYWRPE